MDIALSLGTIIIVNIAAWLTPGANMLAVITASLTLGRAHGLATGFGLACGAIIWATFAALGVAVLFELFPKAMIALKLAGAAYLVWLGLKALRAARKNDDTMIVARAHDRALKESFKSGIIISITNPKAALFFGSVMTAFIPATAPDWFLAVVVVICGFLGVVLHSITATLFSTDVAIRVYRRCQKSISYAFSLIFMGLGGSIAYAALRRTS
ncbi:LysE family transporter [Maribius pontilimi]|uniref:LysE family transporter n=1 Tax=Palleronia pontilimi TaxID=1964209 RepID=A0A934IKE3_9RHOB|nr:LysE family transporter [Palleronia pontilimi]MBJ3764591.1 LysE family transporter [Palleronia pontilimi]